MNSIRASVKLNVALLEDVTWTKISPKEELLAKGIGIRNQANILDDED